MEKMNTAICFVLPCSSLWYTLFFLSMLFSWRKLQNKIACFDFFEKGQKTPRRRAWKNEEDGSLHFFRRPPENGLILHRSCIIYDGGRLPEIVILSFFQFPWEMQKLWHRRAAAGQAPILIRICLIGPCELVYMPCSTVIQFWINIYTQIYSRQPHCEIYVMQFPSI